MKLTLKQQRFADEYLSSGDAAEAARKAGYSPKTARQMGNENLTKPSVREYIEGRLERTRAEKIAEAEEVLEYLTAVLRGESDSTAPALCGQGEQRALKKAPGERERMKAAELLGKRYGIFTDKADAEGAIPVVIVGEDKLED